MTKNILSTLLLKITYNTFIDNDKNKGLRIID